MERWLIALVVLACAFVAGVNFTTDRPYASLMMLVALIAQGILMELNKKRDRQ